MKNLLSCWPRRQATVHRATTILLGLVLATPAVEATQPYQATGPFVGPAINSDLPPLPSQVPGKEYSHDQDQTTAGAGGGADNKQVIAWDGIGGAADGLDYSMPFPVWDTPDQLQADAIAHTNDILFSAVQDESAHLVFSVDDDAHTTANFGLSPVTVPSAGPVLAFSNSLGGAGELSYELGLFGATHPVNTQGVWASQVDINSMPPPHDVDGVELWGPEPGSVPAGAADVAQFGDADKYSIDIDILTLTSSPQAYSVFSYPSQAGYVPHQQVVDLVVGLLGPDGGDNVEPDEINLDALMVFDEDGVPEEFSAGDRILFSVRQMIDAAGTADSSGYFATGSEIFWLDGASTAGAPVGGFLTHGGHLWDKKYALTDMVATLNLNGGDPVRVQLDINALEAVTVPEPTGGLLWGVGWWLGMGRRNKGNRTH